jgi:tRNA pseudouridine13 synthase
MSAAVPDPDLSAGMLVYSTSGESHAGRLRHGLDSFQVEELLDLAGLQKERGPGFVPVYRLTKQGIDTPHAALILEKTLKSRVTFAGMKDAKATTVQYASARSSRAEAPELVKESRFEAQLVGFSPEPIRKGMIAGNRFVIRVETPEDLTDQVNAVFAACSQRRLANFFGYQRFGLRGATNWRVGKAIVNRDFKEAARLVVGEERVREGEETREARRLASEGRYGEALVHFSKGQDIERSVASRLAEKPDDFLGAFRRIRLPIRRLFVHSYQAYLFNLTLSRAVQAGLDIARALPGDNWTEVRENGILPGRVHGVREPLVDGSVPLVQLVGYAFRNYGSRFDGIIAELLREEELKPARFYLKEAEEMSSEGGFRHAPLLARDLSQERGGGEHAISFTLGKGEYGTVLLREVLKPSDPRESGF